MSIRADQQPGTWFSNDKIKDFKMLPSTFQNKEINLKIWTNKVILALTIYLGSIYTHKYLKVWIWILKKNPKTNS